MVYLTLFYIRICRPDISDYYALPRRHRSLFLSDEYQVRERLLLYQVRQSSATVFTWAVLL